MYKACFFHLTALMTTSCRKYLKSQEVTSETIEKQIEEILFLKV